MEPVNRSFQIFAKPAGAACNLACDYCYYSGSERPDGAGAARMSDAVLDAYIRQHIEASSDDVVRFSWHGSEPTVAGLEFYRRVVELQRRYCPSGRRIANGIQTNGTLIDDAWARFFAVEGFSVGISLDGPALLHDCHRRAPDGTPTHERVMRGYRLLQRHRVTTEVLCVVSAVNAARPLEVYRSLREIGVRFLTFIPLVDSAAAVPAGAAVSGSAWGAFLVVVFDEWKAHDIGRVKVQLFDEAAATALGREHALCVLRPVCGDVLVVECNGDVYSCDHFVDPAHRLGSILETHLGELLDLPVQRAFGLAKRETLPRCCIECDVRVLCNGGCPKDRRGDAGAASDPPRNVLCAGYRGFFRHCRPFLDQLRALRPAVTPAVSPAVAARPAVAGGGGAAVGRNAPCPCGSGRKHKHCCLRR